jgi:hypothetical protein
MELSPGMKGDWFCSALRLLARDRHFMPSCSISFFSITRVSASFSPTPRLRGPCPLALELFAAPSSSFSASRTREIPRDDFFGERVPLGG